MHMNLSAEDLAFRDHVRATLDARYTPELRAMNARQAGVFCEPELSRRWHKILFDQGQGAWNPNMPTYADDMWAAAVRAHRQAAAEGRVVTYDNADLARLVANARGEALDAPTRAAFLRQLPAKRTTG